jgi:hypothetical protein
MKKFVLIIAVLVLMLVSGCVNKAMVKSSQAYYDSTKPYLEMVINSKEINSEEKENLARNHLPHGICRARLASCIR